jgi:hypothetical protein
MYGCFADVVAIALACDWRRSFADYIGDVRDHVAAVLDRSEIPFERLVEGMASRGIAVPNLPVIMHVRTPRRPVRAAGLTFTTAAGSAQIPRGVVVGFDQFAEADNCYLAFDIRLYAKEAMAHLLAGLTRFFDEASANSDLPLEELVARARIGRWPAAGN